MANLLFDTPWWLPILLIGTGVVLFWNGNRRQETRLRNIGLLLLGASVVVMGVSYLVDTDVEKAANQSRALARAVEKRDWVTTKAILDPNVTVSVLGSDQLYTSRDQTITALQDGIERWGVSNLRVLSTNAKQHDSLITVTLSIISDHEGAIVRTVNSAWEFEWQQTGDVWSLVRITCIQIGNMRGDAAGAQFPRPR